VRYPSEFVINNMTFDSGSGLAVRRAVQDLLPRRSWLPARWLNDAAGLSLFLLGILIAAWRREGRGLYARRALADGDAADDQRDWTTLARAVHLMIVYAPVAVAWFVVSRIRIGGCRGRFGALHSASRFPRSPCPCAVGVGVLPQQTALRALDDQRVLVENNPHRDTDASP
jgi:hypothetical protein